LIQFYDPLFIKKSSSSFNESTQNDSEQLNNQDIEEEFLKKDDNDINNKSDVDSNLYARIRNMVKSRFPMNEIFSKRVIKEEDIEEIREYLFEEFSYRNVSQNYNDDLNYLINIEYFLLYMNLEIFPKNHQLVNFQEKINSLYFLLEGSVDLLIPKQNKVELTPQDYLMYLSYLKKNNEEKLLKLVIETNNNEVIQSNLILEAHIKKLGSISSSHEREILYLKHKSKIKENEDRNKFNFCITQLQQFISIKKQIKNQFKLFIINTLKKYLENKIKVRNRDYHISAAGINIFDNNNNQEIKITENSQEIKMVENNDSNENNQNGWFKSQKPDDNSYLEKENANNDVINKNTKNQNSNKLNKRKSFIASKPIDNPIIEDKNSVKSNINSMQSNTNEREFDLSNNCNYFSKNTKLDLTIEDEEILENIEKQESFRKENLIFVRKCLMDHFTNFINPLIKITQKDYFYSSIYNYYVLNYANLKKKRVLNVRIRIYQCICKKNIKNKPDNDKGYFKLNFKIDLEKLEEKIFKYKPYDYDKDTKSKDSISKYSNSVNKSIKSKFTDSKKNLIAYNNDFSIDEFPICCLNEGKKFEKKFDLEIKKKITANQFTNKYSLSNLEISGFFVSNYFEEIQIKKNNLNSENKFIKIDIFNEDFSDEEEEIVQDNERLIEKLIKKLQERYKIIKIPYEIYEYVLVKSIKKGEIIFNLFDKIKCHPVIISKQDSYCLKISKEIFEEKLDEMNKSNVYKIFSFFSYCPIFKDLNKTLFYKLFTKRIRYKALFKNQKVIKEGDTIHELLFIREGTFILKIKKSIREINEIIKILSSTKTCHNEDIENDKSLGINAKFRNIYISYF